MRRITITIRMTGTRNLNRDMALCIPCLLPRHSESPDPSRAHVWLPLVPAPLEWTETAICEVLRTWVADLAMALTSASSPPGCVNRCRWHRALPGAGCPGIVRVDT